MKETLRRKVMDAYIGQLIKLAENLSELMCENLGIEKGYIKESFSGGKGPSVGTTKVAKYPQCPQLELVRGLREHADAGGIILLLQDDQVPGLEFFKDGQWVEIPPSKNNTIFVNMGDQVEVLASYISFYNCLNFVGTQTCVPVTMEQSYKHFAKTRSNPKCFSVTGNLHENYDV
ncbi:1-aminocyclopropane-1-carboxylate oxidase 1-like [Actinidia eriantha]|uniref:1-aminocyclopropane-1-carboxylate oxidase 1-like n=1 Tax=Actinidia eriantha TaxID=165200 RepID=UPI0025839F88|nr:1-aminocyclopropane-1-carboxylate oxidase 1-like [Actinidia eriantha]